MKIVRAIISIIFAIEGITKLIGAEFQHTLFRHWGYPVGFMKVIGTLELISALALWIKYFNISFYANTLLLIIMIGALYTHLSSGDPFKMMGLAILATVLLCIHIVKGYK